MPGPIRRLMVFPCLRHEQTAEGLDLSRVPVAMRSPRFDSKTVIRRSGCWLLGYRLSREDNDRLGLVNRQLDGK
jgi:hypothetical protein